MKSTQKLLSLVVPTLNRRGLLEITLNSLLIDIEGFESDVEFVVVNNASDDNTLEFLNEWSIGKPVRIASFDKRVNIDESFQRCVDITTGRFINIFGDDDLPIPGFISRTIDLIKKSPDVDIFYYNRLIGDINLKEIGELAHPNYGVGDERYPTAVFIARFTHWPGFISSLIFSRAAWISGEAFYSDNYIGYKFLARIYAGCAGRQCIYAGIPALIQRRGKQVWKKEWPRYWLVNMPKLLNDLDHAGITNDALNSWSKNEVTSKRLAIDCLVAKAYDYSASDIFWTEAAKFQPAFRRILLKAVQFLLPTTIAKVLYFSGGKYGSK